MLIEWISLVSAGSLLGLFSGIATFLLIYLSSIIFFRKPDGDFIAILSMVIVIIMLLGYYGFSFQTFIEASQPRGRLVHGVALESNAFVVSNILFLLLAYFGIYLSRSIFYKKLFGF
ncbi:hypothetical protein HYD28_11890 [Pseudoalteromonas shioyasakiensis]|nr:hypothetical protein HYD28_11890 [Pseudoalteromonas shioyasakiensis]